MKHSLLRLFILAVACIGFSASGYAAEKTTNLHMTSQELVNYYGVDYVTNLMETLCPESAKAIGHDTLVELFTSVAEGNEAAVISRGILDGLEDYLIYLQQVLPLYNYLTADRAKPEMADISGFDIKQVYATPKDACYYGIGDPRNTFDPKGIDCDECVNNGGKLKTNGSYVWAMTHSGKKLFWGTLPNLLCSSGLNYFGNPGAGIQPYENSCWVCEFSKGPAADVHPVLGDIVDPRIFVYDTESGVVQDITPEDFSVSDCQGFRSAAAHNGVVFLGGPTLEGNNGGSGDGSLFIAYDAETGECLGTSDMSQVSGCKITNVRNWLVVRDVLYCGVAITDQKGVQRGAIIRWFGDKTRPFDFEIVGYTDNQAAEIVEYHDRIYIAGWGTGNFPNPCVYCSPEIPEGGFTPENPEQWETVWNYNEAYEHTPIAGGVLSGMFKYKDYLYWGTMTTPYMQLTKALAQFGSVTSPKAMAYIMGSVRATTLWRMNKAGKVELLYGEEELPAMDAEGKWSIQPNKTSIKPLFGPSGYGNITTNYTWCSAEYNGIMYVGTMDFGKLVGPAIENYDFSAGDDSDLITSLMGSSVKNLLNSLGDDAGYEMFMIDDPEKPIEVLTRDGFGNDAAYGLRNLEVIDNTLYLGTANPFNLHPKGGWEVLSFTDKNLNGVEGVAADDYLTPGFIYRYANEYVKLNSVDGKPITSIQVYDIEGRLVATDTPNEAEAYVVTTDYQAGVYVIKASTDALTRSFKIVVK